MHEATLTLTLTFLISDYFGSRTLATLFHYRKGQKKQKLLACGNLDVNANLNFFEHDLLWLANARGSFSLQKKTEITEKNRNLLAGARRVASYAAILSWLAGTHTLAAHDANCLEL